MTKSAFQKAKEKLEEKTFEKRYNYLVHKGKYYEITNERGDVTFKENTKNALARINKAKKMANILQNSLDKEAVLVEAIMKLSNIDLDILYHNLTKSKRKFKPKTREHHCVDMKVGNFVLPIVD